MRWMLLGVWAQSLVLGVAMAADINVTKVIGTEFPGRYKHPASITELDNGDLYLAYYGGSGEYDPTRPTTECASRKAGGRPA